jgi:hypothetical protein
MPVALDLRQNDFGFFQPKTPISLHFFWGKLVKVPRLEAGPESASR